MHLSHSLAIEPQPHLAQHQGQRRMQKVNDQIHSAFTEVTSSFNKDMFRSADAGERSLKKGSNRAEGVGAEAGE